MRAGPELVPHACRERDWADVEYSGMGARVAAETTAPGYR
jgi:hypothetical protein